MKRFEIKPITNRDQNWIINLLKNHWGSPKIVTRGKIHDASRLPGFIAWQNKLKPSIPQIGINGIPLRDEIELEIILSQSPY